MAELHRTQFRSIEFDGKFVRFDTPGVNEASLVILSILVNEAGLDISFIFFQ